MKNVPFIISIDGNIGSGKTTLLNKLKEKYKSNKNIIFLKEPVGEWEKIKDIDGKTMLEKFYCNQIMYAFSFQMMAYISRLSIIRNAVKLNPNAIFITERSLFTDKYIFAQMLYDQGKIEDVNYQIYLNWFDEFANDFPINSVIWVNTEPEICHQRIKLRARPGEEIISIDYLIDCNFYHHSFINEMNTNTILLDGNVDIFQDSTIMDNWIKRIDKELINCE
jgi:deoxyadenosine/deoxycytidine kinase